MSREERIMAAAIIMRDAVEEMMRALEPTAEGAQHLASSQGGAESTPPFEVGIHHPIDACELRRAADVDERIRELE